MFPNARWIRFFPTTDPLLHSLPAVRTLFSYSFIKSQLRSFEVGTGAKSPLKMHVFAAHLKYDGLVDAQNMFDPIPDTNVITWTTMIYSCARKGSYIESIDLFSRMQVAGVIPDSFSMVAILISCSGMQNHGLIESVHGRVIKSGFAGNSYVGTALLNAYARCKLLGHVCEFFRQVNDPDLVYFNVMLAGFSHCGLHEEAVQMFNTVQALGLKPNHVTMLGVIRTHLEMGSVKSCGSVHGYVIKVGFGSCLAVMNSVLDMHLALGDGHNAARHFDRMETKDVISWTSMLGFLVRVEHLGDALKLYHTMRNVGIIPDSLTIVHLISVCALLGDLSGGRSIHNRVLSCRFRMELPVMNSLIAMYSKCGDLFSARIVFDSIASKSLVTWTSIISGCVLNGQPMEAIRLLAEMKRDDTIVPDSVVTVCLVAASGDLAILELCSQFHGHVVKAGFGTGILIQNGLMTAYAKCGDVKQAYKVFDKMCVRDIVSWNSLIYGCGINGEGRAAVALFNHMKDSSEEPDTVTYLSVLNACNHSGLVDDGLVIFHSLREREQITVKKEHCSCVVDLLARAGQFEVANEYACAMEEEVGPSVWRAVLGGSRVHEDLRLGEIAGRKVLDFDYKDVGNLVLISNILKSVRKFELAELLRLNLRRKGLHKAQAVSLVGTVVHTMH